MLCQADCVRIRAPAFSAADTCRPASGQDPEERHTLPEIQVSVFLFPTLQQMRSEALQFLL